MLFPTSSFSRKCLGQLHGGGLGSSVTEGTIASKWSSTKPLFFLLTTFLDGPDPKAGENVNKLSKSKQIAMCSPKAENYLNFFPTQKMVFGLFQSS